MFCSAGVMMKREVLRIYKQILRTGRTWTAQNPQVTEDERQYIISEARSLFRKNKSIADEGTAKECLREAQSRLDLALHYRNPYPRPVNLPTGSLSPSHSEHLKSQQRLRKASRPIYVRSEDA